MIINEIALPLNSVNERAALNTQETQALIVGRGSYILGVSIRCDEPFNMHIGQFCSIADKVEFVLLKDKDYTRVTTSDDMRLAPLPSLALNSSRYISGQLIVQNDVRIGRDVVITGGLTIGDGAIIEASSHVYEDVPPYAIVRGNPAQIIKYRFNEDQIKELINIAWWDWTDEQLEQRKPDFSLPIDEFIAKYKRDLPKVGQKGETSPKFIMFPDMDIPLPLYKRVIREFIEFEKEGLITGKLTILANDEEKVGQLKAFIGENGSSDNIEVLTVSTDDEERLLGEANYIITTREPDTVRHICTAQRYNTKVLAGSALPSVFDKIVRN